jgi:sulfoxide reductase catalytic subunit YedY
MEKAGFSRRKVLVSSAALTVAATAQLGSVLSEPLSKDRKASQSDFSSVQRNPLYTLDRPLTPRKLVTTYNNFFEFGSHKKIWKSAQQLPLHPWPIQIDGLVQKPMTTDFLGLMENFLLEERWLRHRCVEAWSMTVPWIGFPLRSLVELVQPLPSAKYLKMTSFMLPQFAAGQRQHWLPWPYVESITINEAKNALAMLAVGLHGKPLPPQNGAPLRLVLPWKYGFKSIKSIQKFTFLAERPTGFWQELAGTEYGFWANVNPDIAHPRWSQKTEKALGTNSVFPTQLYNGYANFVAPLYRNLEHENLYT